MKKVILVVVLALFLVGGAFLGVHLFKEKVYLEKDVKCDFDDGICYDVKGKPITGRIVAYENEVLLSDISYVDGKEDGVLKIYRNDGKIYLEGTYSKGKPNGYVKEYNEDGSIHSYDEFVNGEQHGKSIIYQAQNKVLKEWYYNMGKDVGVGRVFYENGKPQLEINFDLGELKYYFDNGSVQTVAHFNDSGYNGDWTIYDIDGKITAELVYENGVGKSGYCLKNDGSKAEFNEEAFIDFAKNNRTPCD